MESFKLVVVGDGAVGKTCMLISYTMDGFPTEYVPTIFDTYEVEKSIENKSYVLTLHDTAGQETYDRLRPLSYGQTNLFLVCYSIATPGSLENVKEKWVPEITHYCPDVPFILVGTQADLRNDPKTLKTLADVKREPVPKEIGENVAKELKALSYKECSALTQAGLEEVFQEALLILHNAKHGKKNKKNRDRKKRCTIL